MPTALKLTPEKLAVYRATAQRRREQEKAELAHRREQAWTAARQAAQLLKEEFKARHVVVFGSLARESGFTRWSDVDIAAWGIDLDPELAEKLASAAHQRGLTTQALVNLWLSEKLQQTAA